MSSGDRNTHQSTGLCANVGQVAHRGVVGVVPEGVLLRVAARRRGAVGMMMGREEPLSPHLARKMKKPSRETAVHAMA